MGPRGAGKSFLEVDDQFEVKGLAVWMWAMELMAVVGLDSQQMATTCPAF
jgi:hypothetical protein